MKLFFLFIEAFLLNLIFTKDELHYKSKHFNPLKIIIVVFLVLGTTWGGYVTYKFYKLSEQDIEKKCPGLYKKV